MTNRERIMDLSSRCRSPVREAHGEIGVIETIYADLISAVDARVVLLDWYDIQSIRPQTPKEGIWYHVILPEGTVLAGEDDLLAVHLTEPERQASFKEIGSPP
jgi:hypothetical protein